MFNITSYQRNANRNDNEVSPHTSENGHQQKNLLAINAGEGVEKREPYNTVDGECEQESHCTNVKVGQ